MAKALAAWGRLTQHAQFQRAGRGRRVNAAAFTLHANARSAETCVAGPRFGLTVTKKTGDSPARHRIKRRLREALRRVSAQDARPDHDYVLMARREALSQRFDALVADIEDALAKANRRRDGRA